MKFTIEILGHEWTVLVTTDDVEPRLKDCTGFTDWTSRKVVVSRIPESDTNLDYPDALMRKVLRHEIIHAYMFESGLGDDWTHPEVGHDETMIDWMAYHLHKLEMVCGNAEGELMMRLLEERKHGRQETDQPDSGVH